MSKRNREYLVPYHVMYKGVVRVMAPSKEAAEAVVKHGEFDNDSGQERVSWGLSGGARRSDGEDEGKD